MGHYKGSDTVSHSLVVVSPTDAEEKAGIVNPVNTHPPYMSDNTGEAANPLKNRNALFDESFQAGSSPMI